MKILLQNVFFNGLFKKNNMRKVIFSFLTLIYLQICVTSVVAQSLKATIKLSYSGKTIEEEMVVDKIKTVQNNQKFAHWFSNETPSSGNMLKHIYILKKESKKKIKKGFFKLQEYVDNPLDIEIVAIFEGFNRDYICEGSLIIEKVGNGGSWFSGTFDGVARCRLYSCRDEKPIAVNFKFSL